MSAPVTDRSRSARGGAGVDPARGARRVATATRTRTPAVPAQRAAGGEPRGAAARAYARRDDRTKRLAGTRAERAAATGRPRFVLLMMVLLASGLIATLWLSTAAAADSYRLEDARLAARQMSEQSGRLHREVATMSSPTSLAERAADLGMVPVQDSARLVVEPSGEVDVVGTPRAAVAPAPPAPPAPPCPPPAALPAESAAAPAAPVCGAPAPGAAAVPAGEAPAVTGTGETAGPGSEDGNTAEQARGTQEAGGEDAAGAPNRVAADRPAARPAPTGTG